MANERIVAVLNQAIDDLILMREGNELNKKQARTILTSLKVENAQLEEAIVDALSTLIDNMSSQCAALIRNADRLQTLKEELEDDDFESCE